MIQSSPYDTEILTHYLADENIDEATVNLEQLAARTTLFSGSDLRNVVVSAALAAFKESTSVDWNVQYGADGLPLPAQIEQPAQRVIAGKHFDLALKQIAACGATNRKDLEELRKWEKEMFQSDYYGI